MRTLKNQNGDQGDGTAGIPFSGYWQVASTIDMPPVAGALEGRNNTVLVRGIQGSSQQTQACRLWVKFDSGGVCTVFRIAGPDRINAK